MSPKARKKENKSLPERWRLRRGVYWYRVPEADREMWDGKQEFKLGKSLSQAHDTFARRLAEREKAQTTDAEFASMAQVFDHYLLTVTALKKPATQRPERQWIASLRALYGDARPEQLTPKVINRAKHSTAKNKGIPTANKHLAVLSHVCTMMIEWGLISTHPMTGKKVTRLKYTAPDKYIPSDAEIERALGHAPAVLRHYVNIKLLTGLRQTDMLKLRLGDIKPRALIVRIQKSQRDGKSGRTLEIDMTPELGYWLEKARGKKNGAIETLWLFQTRNGTPYIDDKDDASSFNSMWQRWQKKIEGLGMQRFQERSLRTKVGHDSASDEDARERLGHEAVSTTRKFYRPNSTKVTPLKRSEDR